MERNPFNGEKPFDWREKPFDWREKPFDWRESFQLERNLSIGEKPFDQSQLKFLHYWHYCRIDIVKMISS